MHLESIMLHLRHILMDQPLSPRPNHHLRCLSSLSLELDSMIASRVTADPLGSHVTHSC